MKYYKIYFKIPYQNKRFIIYELFEYYKKLMVKDFFLLYLFYCSLMRMIKNVEIPTFSLFLWEYDIYKIPFDSLAFSSDFD